MRSILLAVVALFLAAPSYGLDPTRYLSQYGHTAWRLQDGAFAGAPDAIAQTTDGYLWLGTQSGLLRFDGVRFVPFAPPTTERLFYPSIVSLLGTKDGSLWIGTGTGLYRLKEGGFTALELRGQINDIHEDAKGDVWIVRARAGEEAPALCKVRGTESKCYGKDEGVPVPFAGELASDVLGNIWVGSTIQLVRWPRNTSSFTYTLPGMPGNAVLDGISALAPLPDGSILVGARYHGVGLQILSNDHWKAYALPGFDGRSLAVTALLLDRENSLWIGTQDEGIYRVVAGKVDRFRGADGLSGDTVANFYEDHEGNVWVVTPNGIDRFRNMSVVSFSKHEGLSADMVHAVLAARDNTIWLGNGGALDSLNQDQVSSIAGPRLPGKTTTSLLEDHEGRLWVGIDDQLAVLTNGKFIPIKKKDGRPTGTVISMAEDSDHNIWAHVLPNALLRIKEDQVQEEIPGSKIPYTYTIVPDPQGGIWLGFSEDRLARYHDGQLQIFTSEQPPPRGTVSSIVISADGFVLGGSGRGLIALHSGTVHTLTAKNGLPCERIDSMLSDNQKNLWLYMRCGLVEISAADLAAWWKAPDATVNFRSFDAFDGVHPGHPPFQPTAAAAPDGRLWFANENVIQVIDPLHLRRNTLPPPVHIEQVVADRKIYSSNRDLNLPALTKDLRIDYTALSFVVPEKVRFRYRLDGHDRAWEEAGTRRQAFYSDLGPGDYQFHVIAANNDGIWNEAGASLRVSVAAAWYQTQSFKVLCVLLGGFLVWCIYHVRVRQLAATMGARFDERMAERTRLAQELHDTLLQTIQGTKMVADDALDESTDFERMRATMRRVSQWLGQATQEGRAALSSLRVSVTSRNDLAEAFRRAADDCLIHRAMEVNLSVIGEPREMHPIARDEVYRIGYEAIRNACSHSGGTRLTIQLTFAQDLSLRVSDNGTGMDIRIAEHGKDGHFGLRGMHERAARIGGKISISSSAESGTDISLVVPGKIIFRGMHERPKSLLAKIKDAVLRRTPSDPS